MNESHFYAGDFHFHIAATVAAIHSIIHFTSFRRHNRCSNILYRMFGIANDMRQEMKKKKL